MMDSKVFKMQLSALTVFRSLLTDPVLEALGSFLLEVGEDKIECAVADYCEFVSRLYEANGGNLTRYVEKIVNNSENVYVKTLGKGETPSDPILQSVQRELAFLQNVATLSCEKLCEMIGWEGDLPTYAVENIDLAKSYLHRGENIGKYGYGKYADHHMFCVNDEGRIAAVKNPDTISLDQLVDYENERGKVVDNTKALLCGKPAANMLLTGDAGTGKSSTIKAVGNAFHSDGLRIVEVRKDQLAMIPKVMEELSQNPLKFVLFIDDLSFLSDDDNFNALKAVLEGSVSVRSRNVVVYATSNRRHIIRERHSDREGDDIHRNDTMQEVISLSNRFGLHITFQRPDKKTYLHIVKDLASHHNIQMPEEEIDLLAEQFALERGGRSARLARQFVDSLLSR